jgi:uncharacterized protein
MDKNYIIHLIEDDSWMMDLLETVQALGLPDWWIGAGFIRSKVWDHLHGYTHRTPLPDIDVIYFDKTDFTSAEASQETTASEIFYEQELKKKHSDIHWSVTNQARMHLFHDDEPYQNSTEALSNWVETATCIGASLDKNNKVILTSPRGIEDLVHLILRPTPGVYKDTATFMKRVSKKEWLQKWPKLKIEDV